MLIILTSTTNRVAAVAGFDCRPAPLTVSIVSNESLLASSHHLILTKFYYVSAEMSSTLEKYSIPGWHGVYYIPDFISASLHPLCRHVLFESCYQTRTKKSGISFERFTRMKG